MAESTARHARESTARAAAGMQVSRETIRKVKCIAAAAEVHPLAARALEEIQQGQLSAGRAYQILFDGRDLSALYARIPPELHERLRAEARYDGITMSALLTRILSRYYDWEPTETV